MRTVIALSKGRLAQEALRLMELGGIRVKHHSQTRKLVILDDDSEIMIVLLKPWDVMKLLRAGSLDMGVIGSDVLKEFEDDLLELMDLGFGRCKMSIAGQEGYILEGQNSLRVATKYPVMAKEYFDSLGIDAEIVELEGSIEVAPIIGLSDVILDIVETGLTIKDNGLSLIRDVCSVSARLVCNRGAYFSNSEKIKAIVTLLEGAMEYEGSFV